MFVGNANEGKLKFHYFLDEESVRLKQKLMIIYLRCLQSTKARNIFLSFRINWIFIDLCHRN